MIFDAVILTGGRSSRLGGTPKAELIIDDATLLTVTLRAAQDARQIVIVGTTAAAVLPPGTIVTRESPPFGGPAAAIAAGLGAATGTPAEWVMVLACDMPSAALAVPALFATLGTDGTVAVDVDREQYLLAVYRRRALLDRIDALGGQIAGGSMRSLISVLDLHRVAVAPGSSADVDTWDDAAKLGITMTIEGTP